jgi:hypothetical protein
LNGARDRGSREADEEDECEAQTKEHAPH